MKKFASFVPVIGIFLVFYLLAKKENSTTIWPNGFYYFGSAACQAASITLILSFF